MPKVKVTQKKGEKGWRARRQGSRKKQKAITTYTVSEPREEPDAVSPAKGQRRLRSEDVQRQRRDDDSDSSVDTALSVRSKTTSREGNFPRKYADGDARTSNSDITTRPNRRQPSQSGGRGRASSRSSTKKPSDGEDFSKSSGSGESDRSDTEERVTTASRKRSETGSQLVRPPSKRQRKLQSEDTQPHRGNDKSASTVLSVRNETTSCKENFPRKHARGDGSHNTTRPKKQQLSQSRSGGQGPSRPGTRKPTAGGDSSTRSSGSGESDHSDTEGRMTTSGRQRTETGTKTSNTGTRTSRASVRKAILKTTESDLSDREQHTMAAHQKQRHLRKAQSGLSISRSESSESNVYDYSESAEEDQGMPLRRKRPKRVSFAHSRSSGGPRTNARGGGSSSWESESEGGGESGGRQRNKASVREVQVAGSSVAKWQTMSQEARKVFSDAMLAGLGQCLEGVSEARRQRVERELQHLITRVKQKLETTKAPKRTGRMKFSYSGMRQRVAELKEKCLSLVQRNQELEQKLEERKRSIEERQQKAEQLAGAASSSAESLPTVNVEDYPEPPEESDSDGEAFLGYVVELVGRSRVASMHGRERMAAGGLL